MIIENIFWIFGYLFAGVVVALVYDVLFTEAHDGFFWFLLDPSDTISNRFERPTKTITLFLGCALLFPLAFIIPTLGSWFVFLYRKIYRKPA